MALFTDGAINGPADLQNYESGILDVASSEGIDAGGKSALAQAQLASELILFLRRRFQLADFSWAMTVRRNIGLDDVAVTDPLRRWHAYKTLALIYQDAYNNQLNDRYQGKWRAYEQLAKESLESFFKIGVGMVAGPIPRAPAPVLSTVAGTGGGGTYYVATTWQNASGQQGAPSDTKEITVGAGQQLVVGTTNPPAIVAGWNAYVGIAPGSISLQNSAPIAIGSTWTMTAALVTGRAPGDGQEPTWFLIDKQLIERG